MALFATANTTLIIVTAGSRLLFGMARGGNAPPLLSNTLPGRKTPAAAIVLAGLGAMLFLPLGSVGLVGSVASMLSLGAFASVNAALVRIRLTHPEAERPFRVPLAVGRVPVLTIAGLLVVCVLLTQFSLAAYGIAVAALVAAFVIQAVPWARHVGEEALKPRE